MSDARNFTNNLLGSLCAHNSRLSAMAAEEPAVEMMTLSTGEVISRAEWARRVTEASAKITHYWDTHPAENAAMERRYIEAMQRDPKKD